MMGSGWMINYMRKGLGWEVVKTYKHVFWAYAGFGLIKLCLALALSKAIEVEKKDTPSPDPETAPLLGDGAEDEEPKKKKSWIASKLPEISPESRIIVVNLCILFALDAFASGLAPL